jgi:RNA polymerase sigma factor (sigma-70 family)
MSVHAERSSAVVEDLDTLFRSGTATGLDETQLLRRFAHHRDEAAFRLLVERHGPRVLGVCRRILDDHHLADDAFQATFLVLARRATSIGRPDRLGGWLIGVARRVARKAQVSAMRRSQHERLFAEQAPTQTASAADGTFELAGLLAEELQRLPDNHRRAVELCCLEGLSTDEAARRLGCPRGTDGTRVARGRERLKRGLERRGATFSAALAAGNTRLPRLIVHNTVRAAVAFSKASVGPVATTAGAVSPAVVALAESALRSFFMTKLSLASATITTAIAVGGFVTYRAVGARGPGEVRAAASTGAAFIDDQDVIQGTWVVTNVKMNGGPPEVPEGVNGMEWTFQGKNIQTSLPLGDGKTTFKLALEGDQRTITITDGTGKTFIALYQLGDEELRLALGPKESEPPVGFDAKGDAGRPVMVLTLLPKAKAPKLAPEQQEKAKKSQSSAHTAAARALSVNNLKQIGLAMHNFADSNGGFPAAAICDDDNKPLLSWRVAILPYIEQEALYREFRLNEPWDSAHNKALIAKMPKLYAPVGREAQNAKPGTTFYQAFVGGGALFDVAMPRPLAKIADGTSYTLLIVEGSDPVTWTQPTDIGFDKNAADPPKVGGALFEGGFNAGFADGSVRFIKDTIDPRTLKALITANGGEVFDPQSIP